MPSVRCSTCTWGWPAGISRATRRLLTSQSRRSYSNCFRKHASCISCEIRATTSFPMRKAWNQNAVRATQRWKDSIRDLHNTLAANSVSFVEVRYEDLLTEPQQTVSKVCDYLNIPFDSRMLEFDKPSENIGDAKGALGVVKGNFGKWKKSLKPTEVETIESIAGVTMQEFGYDLQGQAGDREANPLYLRLARLFDSWNRFRFIYRDEGSLSAAVRRILRTTRFRVRNG